MAVLGWGHSRTGPIPQACSVADPPLLVNTTRWHTSLGTLFPRHVVDARTIDRLNILQASMLAMKEAALVLPRGSFDFALVDGNRLPEVRRGGLECSLRRGGSSVPVSLCGNGEAGGQLHPLLAALFVHQPRAGRGCRNLRRPSSGATPFAAASLPRRSSPRWVSRGGLGGKKKR